MTEGVASCAVVVKTTSVEHAFVGRVEESATAGWQLDLPLDFEGELRLRANGEGEAARQLVSYIAHLAQRRAGILEGRVELDAGVGSRGKRTGQLMRQATVGALTSALLHNLASTVQMLDCAVSEIDRRVGDRPDLEDSLSEARAASQEIVQQFVNMRRLIRSGEVSKKPIDVAQLVERTVQLTGTHIRGRAVLRVGEVPAVKVEVSQSLFIQVLNNLIRNAVNASPEQGTVDLTVRVVDRDVVFSVVDDGPGVAEVIADTLFEPFATNSVNGTGLGLTISAHIMQLLGGRIQYRKHPERGAAFSVMLPVAP